MATIRITSLRTLNQYNQDVRFFRRQDALSLTMFISASANLLTPPEPQANLTIPVFDAVFQIIDPLTDTVIVNERWEGHEFTWGGSFFISAGNWSGPSASDYSTPERWGLSNGIFGFRGIVLAYWVFAPEGGLIPIEGGSPFSISSIRWFRVDEN